MQQLNPSEISELIKSKIQNLQVAAEKRTGLTDVYSVFRAFGEDEQQRPQAGLPPRLVADSASS